MWELMERIFLRTFTGKLVNMIEVSKRYNHFQYFNGRNKLNVLFLVEVFSSSVVLFYKKCWGRCQEFKQFFIVRILLSKNCDQYLNLFPSFWPQADHQYSRFILPIFQPFRCLNYLYVDMKEKDFHGETLADKCMNHPTLSLTYSWRSLKWLFLNETSQLIVLS